MPDIIKWYTESLGLDGEDKLYPRFRKGEKGEVVPVKNLAVSYSTARQQLKEEQARLGLEGLTWHSGRIGGASDAAGAGLNKDLVIKPCGGWRSSAVDTYIRTEGPGVIYSSTMLKKF